MSGNDGKSMNQGGKNVLSFFLRFGVSAALLIWLFRNIDVAGMVATIKGADPGYMLAAGALFIVLNVVLICRWFVFVRALGLQLDIFSATRWYLIGLFYNLFLPTAIGGDVVRAIGLSRNSTQKPKIVASIFLDRLSGFAGIVIVAVAACAFGSRLVNEPKIIQAIIVMAALSLVITAVFFNHTLYSLACRIFSLWPKAKDALMQLHYNIVLMNHKRREGLAGIGISCLSQAFLAFDFFLIARALHLDIDLVYFFIFSPMVCVVTALPSIGGLGFREVGWASLLATVGVDKGMAASISLVCFAFMVMVGLLGGMIYVTTLSSGRVQHHQEYAGISPS